MEIFVLVLVGLYVVAMFVAMIIAAIMHSWFALSLAIFSLLFVFVVFMCAAVEGHCW